MFQRELLCQLAFVQFQTDRMPRTDLRLRLMRHAVAVFHIDKIIYARLYILLHCRNRYRNRARDRGRCCCRLRAGGGRSGLRRGCCRLGSACGRLGGCGSCLGGAGSLFGRSSCSFRCDRISQLLEGPLLELAAVVFLKRQTRFHIITHRRNDEILIEHALNNKLLIADFRNPEILRAIIICFPRGNLYACLDIVCRLAGAVDKQILILIERELIVSVLDINQIIALIRLAHVKFQSDRMRCAQRIPCLMRHGIIVRCIDDRALIVLHCICRCMLRQLRLDRIRSRRCGNSRLLRRRSLGRGRLLGGCCILRGGSGRHSRFLRGG